MLPTISPTMSDSDSDFVQEERDFSLVHALQTFKATVDSQIDVIKNEPLLLLDDSNNYWWLVKPLSSNQIGYIPAEIVETPSERLARVNRHRNLQLSEFKEQEDYVGKLGATVKNVSFSEEVVDNHGVVGNLDNSKRVSSAAGKFLRSDSRFDESEEDTEDMSDDQIEDEIMEDHEIEDDEEEIAQPKQRIHSEIMDDLDMVATQKPEQVQEREVITAEPSVEQLKHEQSQEKPKDNPTLAKLEGKVRPSPVKNFPKSTKVTAIRIYQGRMSQTQEIAQFKTVAATEITTVAQLLKQAALKFRVMGKLRKSGLDIDKRSSVDDLLGPWFLSLKSSKGERRLENSELIIKVLSDLNVKMDKRRSLFSKSNDQVEVSTLQEEVKVFLNEDPTYKQMAREINQDQSEVEPTTQKSEASPHKSMGPELPKTRPMSSAQLTANVNAVNGKTQRPASSFQHPISELKNTNKKRRTIGIEQPSKRDTYSKAMDSWILARMILNTEKKLVKTVKVPVSVKFGDLVQSTIRKIANKNGVQNIAFDRAYLEGQTDQIVVTDSIRDALASCSILVDERDPKVPINIHVMVRMVADTNMAAQITRKRATITSDLPLDTLLENYGIETVDKSKPSEMAHVQVPNNRSSFAAPTRALPTPGKYDRKPVRAHELINTSALNQQPSYGDSLIAIADGIKGVSSFADFIESISSSDTEY